MDERAKRMRRLEHTFPLSRTRRLIHFLCMSERPLDTHHKALKINLDKTKYGTFAEVGAGQEVARWFFRVGGAAGTVAKTIPAYDMKVSTALIRRAYRIIWPLNQLKIMA